MTEAQTLTLTEFLRARIAEDEAAASTPPGVTWVPSRPGDSWYEAVWGSAFDDHRCDSRSGPLLQVDPRRVLAECEAKRRAIDAAWADHVQIESEWGKNQSRLQMDAKHDVPDVLRHLAAVYSDHPDYRDEWRP